MSKKYVSWVLYAKFRIEKHCPVKQFAFLKNVILGDPGAVSRVDNELDLTVNFHHEHFINPTNCPWVSEDGKTFAINIKFCASSNLLFFYELLYVLLFSCNPIGQLCLSCTGYSSRTVGIDYSCFFFSLINVCRLAFR